MIDNLIKKLKYNLESTFFVGFIINKINEEKMSISFAGSNESFFKVLVEIRSNTRLIIIIEPEKYSAEFVASVNLCSRQQRETFVTIARKINNDKELLTLRINETKYTLNDFLMKNEDWNKLLIKYSKSPFYDESEDRDSVIIDIINLLFSMVLSLIVYKVEGYEEGNETNVHCTKHERNPYNREICLFAKGYNCSVCGFNFEDAYGSIGKKVIEVHHSIPVSQMEKGHKVDPINELFPVCSNCHTMIHKRKIPYTIDELKRIIQKQIQ